MDTKIISKCKLIPERTGKPCMDIDFYDICKQISNLREEGKEPSEIELVIPKGNKIYGVPVKFSNE
jgi:hypothetical protein